MFSKAKEAAHWVKMLSHKRKDLSFGSLGVLSNPDTVTRVGSQSLGSTEMERSQGHTD